MSEDDAITRFEDEGNPCCPNCHLHGHHSTDSEEEERPDESESSEPSE